MMPGMEKPVLARLTVAAAVLVVVLNLSVPRAYG
jgi:hypothetical protein